MFSDALPAASGRSTDTSDISAAREAVIAMGFPDHLVQLAIDICLLDSGTYADVQGLYLAVKDLSTNPLKQAELHMKLYKHAQQQIRQIPPLTSYLNGVSTEKTGSLPNFKTNLLGCPTTEALYKEPLKPSADLAPAGLFAEMSKDSVFAAGEKIKFSQKLEELVRENQKLKERKRCRACRKVELTTSGVTYLPCGHFVTCEHCSELFDDCPSCGINIMGTVRTFLS